jgi:hypothetical protein
MHEVWQPYSLRFMAAKADVNAIFFFTKQGFHISDADGKPEEDGGEGTVSAKTADSERGLLASQSSTECPQYLLNELRKFPETNSQLMIWQTGVAPPTIQ